MLHSNWIEFGMSNDNNNYDDHKMKRKKEKKKTSEKKRISQNDEKKTRQWSNCISIHGGKKIYAKTAIWLKSLMKLVI